VHGLWRDKGIEEESDGTDEELASPFSPQGEQKKIKHFH